MNILDKKILSVILKLKRFLFFFSYHVGVKLKTRNKLVNTKTCEYEFFESLSSDLKTEFILEKINLLLNYANKHVPYYSKIFVDLGWVDSKDCEINIEALQKLNELPILTKRLIRENFKDLQSDEIENLNAYKNSSGGSTGEKAIFFQNDSYKIGHTSAYNAFLKKIGLKPWSKNFLLLWGSPDDIGKPTLPKNIIKHYLFNNHVLLNASDIDDTQLETLSRILQVVSFDYIRGYSQSLFLLARYINKNNIHIKQNIVISTATNLTNEMAIEISQAFNCELYDFYGSREVGAISYSKFDQNNNIFCLNNFVELLQDYDSYNDLNSGKILTTNLNNFVMPLIRYDIGDNASWLGKFNYYNFDKITGRSSSFFKLKNGKRVDGVSLNHLMNELDEIQYFQIIQEDYDLIKFKIVSDNKINSVKTSNIENVFSRIFGETCSFLWEYIDEIPLTSSGKRIYIISKI